jgi:hypothetical protein
LLFVRLVYHFPEAGDMVMILLLLTYIVPGFGK